MKLKDYIVIPVKYISGDMSEELVQDLLNNGADIDSVSYVDDLYINKNNISSFNGSTKDNEITVRMNNGENWNVAMSLNVFIEVLNKE